MAIAKATRDIARQEDIKFQEKEPETVDVQFQEDTPVTKLLYTFTPLEHGVIMKLNFALGPNDNSINGFAYLILSRITNPAFYTTASGQNQVMWRKICGDKYIEGYEGFGRTPLYMHANESFYLYLASNYPAPTKVFGGLTLYCLPTSR